MKKASKEINIFSMSALDLFASALGVFILIAIVLFPYFPYTGTFEQLMEERARSAALQQEVEEERARSAALQQETEEERARSAALQEQLAQAQAERDAEDRLQSQPEACQTNLDQTQVALQECSRIAKRTFVLAVMSWATGDDIDMHVFDPSGRRYFYQKRRYSGSPAELEVDNTRGPGNEIWLHPSAAPGKYTVAYKFYNASSSNSTRVPTRGLILTQETKEELPVIELTEYRPLQIAAEVHVDDEGNIRVDRSRAGETP